MRLNFSAETKYNDLTGNVAADRSDDLSIEDLLAERKLIRDGEIIFGYQIVFDRNPSQPVPNPGIIVYLVEAEDAATVAKNFQANGFHQLRPVELDDLPLAQFFRYFKRFNIMLSNHLDGPADAFVVSQ